jgi:hypothetical protein
VNDLVALRWQLHFLYRSFDSDLSMGVVFGSACVIPLRFLRGGWQQDEECRKSSKKD